MKLKGPCIETDWPLTPGGYGLKGHRYAHRVAWEKAYGPIPKGMNVCHHCDNRSCINPDHLFLGTQKDNVDDMLKKGRGKGFTKGHKRAVGELHGRTKLTNEQVKEIKEILKKDQSYGIKIKLAKRYNVHRCVISHINSGLSWRHIK